MGEKYFLLGWGVRFGSGEGTGWRGDVSEDSSQVVLADSSEARSQWRFLFCRSRIVDSQVQCSLDRNLQLYLPRLKVSQ